VILVDAGWGKWYSKKKFHNLDFPCKKLLTKFFAIVNSLEVF